MNTSINRADTARLRLNLARLVEFAAALSVRGAGGGDPGDDPRQRHGFP
ncbi:hypothetical protein [Pseudomonas sp. H2_E05]